MSVKLFILGLPGSGKSAAAQYIERFARLVGWMPQRFRDYSILYDMYQTDKDGKRFKSTEDRGYDGFDVLDLDVFDEALQELESKVSQSNASSDNEKKLIIIEFSRDDYRKALNFFVSHLADARFLFIEADIPTCIQRIKYRVEHRKTPDDCYVSEYIFEKYYQYDHRDYLHSVVPRIHQQFGIRMEDIEVINNDSTVPEEHFSEQVKLFASTILIPKT